MVTRAASRPVSAGGVRGGRAAETRLVPYSNPGIVPSKCFLGNPAGVNARTRARFTRGRVSVISSSLLTCRIGGRETDTAGQDSGDFQQEALKPKLPTTTGTDLDAPLLFPFAPRSHQEHQLDRETIAGQKEPEISRRMIPAAACPRPMDSPEVSSYMSGRSPVGPSTHHKAHPAPAP